jgi:hypothetical protein
MGGRANKFGVEASADVYSLPRRSRSALGTDGGNYVVALINSLFLFYTSVDQSSPSKRRENNIGLPLSKKGRS